MDIYRTRKADGVLLSLSTKSRKWIFIGALGLCSTPYLGSVGALLLGLGIAQLSGHPYVHLNHRVTSWLLQASVVGLGFGMNLHSAVEAGASGALLTVGSIALTLGFGLLLGRLLRVETKTSFLISGGTAICGGSAIAALSPVIGAKEKQISLALGCVFILNALALIIFPFLGHYFALSQEQFGLWCALAIHDTSSVVGAAGIYGPKALEVATTVKLARALWIIPVACISAICVGGKLREVRIPYFIGLFVVAVLVHTYCPAWDVLAPYATSLAHIGMQLTLFLIGAGLGRNVWKSIGWSPLLQAVLLWVFISGLSLYLVQTMAFI
ncbi:YeiH family protein [Dyadobacter tibetensis]|uniref:YeiH family protein n=1 Tax=Dyadobacter tibetensis TaxID=1211851 RepID=UPI00046F1819|nr:putative sulfate exporter family transporter [Dyadobacter tibetensis]